MSAEHESNKAAAGIDGKTSSSSVENKVCGQSSSDSNSDQKSSAKKPYTKPTLRKFSQIDYVTAYGID